MGCGCYWRPTESLAGIGDRMRGCWAPDLRRRQRDGIRFIHSFNWTITPHVWACRDSLSRSMDFPADWCMGFIGLEELAVVACTCTCKSDPKFSVGHSRYMLPAWLYACTRSYANGLSLSWDTEAGIHVCFTTLTLFIVSSIFFAKWQVLTTTVVFDFLCRLN
jgi:hypothetical protein